jgi:DNA-binding NarL/FixJ family response regulator
MLVPHCANSNPAAPPRTDNSALSVSVFRMSRPRPAPSAARITNSWRSATARIISKLLGLIATGLSNREIAGRLFVSENTVKTHSSRLFDKLGAKRRTQAVQIGKTARLIP